MVQLHSHARTSVTAGSGLSLQVASDLRGRVGAMRAALPALVALHNPALRERHWARVQTVLANMFVREELPLSDLLAMGVHAHQCPSNVSAVTSTGNILQSSLPDLAGGGRA